MITIKETFEDGDEIITKINCTIEEAKKYFENTILNIGTENDRMRKCINVEEIK